MERMLNDPRKFTADEASVTSCVRITKKSRQLFSPKTDGRKELSANGRSAISELTS